MKKHENWQKSTDWIKLEYGFLQFSSFNVFIFNTFLLAFVNHFTISFAIDKMSVFSVEHFILKCAHANLILYMNCTCAPYVLLYQQLCWFDRDRAHFIRLINTEDLKTTGIIYSTIHKCQIFNTTIYIFYTESM